MEKTVLTATSYLRPTAREKLAEEHLSFPHAAVCYVVSDLSQPTPAKTLRHLTGGKLPSLTNADFEPTTYI